MLIATGSSTKTPKISMFGARNTAAMPPRPKRRCTHAMGTLNAPMARCTGQVSKAFRSKPPRTRARAAPPGEAGRTGAPSLAGTMLLRLGHLLLDIGRDAGVGILERQFSRHHLA